MSLMLLSHSLAHTNLVILQLLKCFTIKSKNNRAGEFIFEASGGTHFENFLARCQLWLCPCGFDVCKGSVQKNLGCVTNYFET